MAGQSLGDLAKRIAAAAREANAASSRRGLRVSINDDGPADRRGFDRVFADFDRTLASIPDALRAGVPAVRAAHRANFREQTSGYGGWAALAPSTLRDRRRRGYPPGPILTRSGALREHVLGTPARITRSGNVYELRIAPSPSVGGVPKYRALAKGYSPNNLPARPMVSIRPEHANAVASAISRYMRTRAG